MAFSVNVGRRFPRVIRRWRWQGKLKAMLTSTLPDFVTRVLTLSAYTPDHDVAENQLGKAKNERTDGGPRIEFSKLERIVWDSSWHSSKPKEMLREEAQIHRQGCQPKVQLR